MPVIDHKNIQGGKAYGRYLSEWEKKLDDLNQSFLEDQTYSDVEELPDKLVAYKAKFLEYDQDLSGDLNVMDVKYMMEKLGQAKTHLEVVKMIREVDTTGNGAISYTEFVKMMLGPQSSVLKMILLFESFGKPKEKPVGPPPKRSLDSLP